MFPSSSFQCYHFVASQSIIQSNFICMALFIQVGAVQMLQTSKNASLTSSSPFLGARVNVGRGGDAPLHAAVRQDSADQVSLLLDYGADVNLRDSNNQRPVELAPSGGETQHLLLTFEGNALSCAEAVTLYVENQLTFKRKSICVSPGSPRSLCQLCRIQIRNLIGRSRLKQLPHLPLPSLLTQYLEHT